jgi:trehalose-phosphatase
VTAEEIVREIIRGKGTRHLLLLTDFDGTLCEFDSDPQAVHLNDTRRELLAGLAARPCCTVGIVSGRRLADVRARTGDIGDVYIAGFHGLEIEGMGDSFVHGDAAAAVAAMQEVAVRMAPAIRRLPGVFIEDKGLSIALHFREAEPAHRVVAQSVFVDAARSGLDAGRLRLLPGSCVVELLPRTSWNKGAAVRWVLERVEARAGDTFPVYLGDDVTDADALAAVHSKGIGVAVSERVSGDYAIDGPAGVERLLVALDAELHC